MQDPADPHAGTDAAPALGGGRYRLLDELGEGGAARVYRALDTTSGVTVAIKVLRQDVPGEDRQARFAREAEVLTGLSHPNLVRVHAIGQDGDRDFLVMELVEGGSLQDRLELEGPLGSTDVRRVLVDVLSALTEVHGHQVVHRDVKPGNLLIDSDGSVKLADFGIARVEGSLTRTGTTVGTYAFMAPEQLEDPRAAGPASDLYGLAATAVGLALGQPPFGLQDPVRRAQLLDTLDEDLGPILERALLRDPGARWPDADSMRRAITGEGELRAPTRTSGWLAAGVLLVVGVLGLGLWGVAHEAPRAPRALTAAPVEQPAVAELQEPREVGVITAPEPEVGVSEPAPVPVRPAPIPAPEPEEAPATDPDPAPLEKPVPVEVFIGSKPWAELYVDGRPQRRTPRTLALLPGVHAVRLVTQDGTEKLVDLAVPPQGGTRFCWDFHEEADCPGR